ncbi:MAG: hypothetical protein AAGA08_10650 [Pseudomonadota bacterium]
MTLHVAFFLITLVVQFLLVHVMTTRAWFPQIPVVPAAIGQGVLTLIAVAIAGGFVSGMLWFSLIAYPILYSWAFAPDPDMTQNLQAMQENRGIVFLLVMSPYLYMLIQLYARMIEQRRA